MCTRISDGCVACVIGCVKHEWRLGERKNVLLHTLLPTTVRKAVRDSIPISAAYLLQDGTYVLKYPSQRIANMVIPTRQGPRNETARKPRTCRGDWLGDEVPPDLRSNRQRSRRELSFLCAIPERFDVGLNLVKHRRPCPDEVMQEVEGGVERDVTQPRVVVHHRTRGTANNRTIRIGAARWVDSSYRILAFSVEEGRKDRLFHSRECLLVVGQNQRI